MTEINWHQQGDIYEKHCQEWMRDVWGPYKYIETKINSIHGIDFAIECDTGDVRIVEVKSATGSPRGDQFSLPWIRKRIADCNNPEFRQALCRAFLRRRYMIRVLVRVRVNRDGTTTCSTGNPTGPVTWEDLFPGVPPPQMDIIATTATEWRDMMVVNHQLQGFGICLTHRYELPLACLSSGLRRVILDNGTFPSLVPHSHSVSEGGRLRYDRPLSAWDQRANDVAKAYNGTVIEARCVACGERFFGFPKEQHCSTCAGGVREAAASIKRSLIDRAERIVADCEISNGNGDFRALMESWRQTPSAGPDEEPVLWERFSSLQERFYKRRKEKYEERSLKQRENQALKEDMVRHARQLSESIDWKATAVHLKELMDRWKSVGSAGRDHESDLWDAFNAARQKFFDRQKQYFDQVAAQQRENKRVKEQLIAQARSIAGSSEWKETADQMRDLMTAWKQTGSAGRDHESDLWDAFNAARQKFFDRQKQHFDQVAAQQRENKRVKEQLIAQARSIAGSSEWKETADQMRDLMTAWKQTGSAGRDHESDLWDTFNAVRQKFFDRQKQHFDERQSQQATNAAAKSDLVSQAESLAYSSDWRGTSAAMKQLMTEWRGIGPAGRAEDERLWSRFNQARQTFFTRQNDYFEERERSRRSR